MGISNWGLRRRSVAVGVTLSLGIASLPAPAGAVPEAPEFGSSVSQPYANDLKLPQMQPIRIGNVVLPGQVVAAASAIGLLAVVATIVGVVAASADANGAPDKDSPKPDEDAAPQQSERNEVSREIKQKMMNMRVPAVCTHNAGRLVDGHLEQSAVNYRGAFMHIKTRYKYATDPAEAVNAKWIKVDGQDRILLVAQCWAGGVGWPESLFLLDKDLNFLGVGAERNGLNISSGYFQGRSPFEVVETSGDEVRLRFNALDHGDTYAASSLMIEGTYRIDGQRLVPVGEQKVEKIHG